MHPDVGVCSIGYDELIAVLLLRQQHGHAMQPAPGLWNGRAPGTSPTEPDCWSRRALRKSTAEHMTLAGWGVPATPTGSATAAVRPGGAAPWRRDPAAAVIVSHELPSSKHKSSSLPGMAKTVQWDKPGHAGPAPPGRQNRASRRKEGSRNRVRVRVRTYAPPMQRVARIGVRHSARSWAIGIAERGRASRLRPARNRGLRLTRFAPAGVRGIG